MQKIWLFGDSYAAEMGNSEYAWPKRLSKNYDVKNLAKSGTGPEYMIGQFKREIESSSTKVDELKNISLLFFLSHACRKDFSFLKDPEDQCMMLNFGLDKKFSSHWEVNKSKSYKIYKNFIADFYKKYYLHNNLSDFDHLQFVGILKEYSRFFKKTLVVPVFDHFEESVLYRKFNSEIQDTENFSYARGPALFFIENEIHMHMPNHLSVENHNLMFEQLVNWMENSIPLDTKKLKKLC